MWDQGAMLAAFLVLDFFISKIKVNILENAFFPSVRWGHPYLLRVSSPCFQSALSQTNYAPILYLPNRQEIGILSFLIRLKSLELQGACTLINVSINVPVQPSWPIVNCRPWTDVITATRDTHKDNDIQYIKQKTEHASPYLNKLQSMVTHLVVF